MKMQKALIRLLTINRLGAGLLAALSLVTQAADAEETLSFDIGAQPLEDALRRYMEQSGVDLLYSPKSVQSLWTEGVQGTHAPEQALRALLTSSGLRIARQGDSYLLISAPTNEARTELPATITVTATRTERDSFDTPVSVSVLTSQDIERLHAVKSDDLLRAVPGLDLIHMDGYASASIPVLRGLGQSFAGTTTQSLLNGMPVEPLSITRRYLWYLLDPSMIERIEVVRGPSSVLYGPSAMGGVINVISKRGNGQPFAQATLGGGSHNGRSVAASAGGSVGNFDTYISANHEQTDGYKPLTQTPPPWEAWYPAGYADLEPRDSEATHLNGRLTGWMGDDSDLSIGAYHFRNEGAVLGGHPNYRVEQDGTVIDATLTHRFSDNQQFKTKLAYSDVSAPKRTFDEFSWGEDSFDLAYWDREDEKSFAADVQVNLNPLSGNSLTLGATWWNGEFSTVEYDTSDEETWNSSNKSRTYGIFIQDEHAIDRFTFTLGGRYDIYDHYDYESNGVGIPDADDEVFTPRAAIGYRLDESLSLYGSAGTAYIPASNSLKYRSGPVWLSNPDLQPETATSYEMGLKFRALGNNLTGSLALYRTRYEDKISSIAIGGKQQFQNLGETRINGLELDLRTHLGDHWEPFFNYTYTDSEITRNPTDTALEGNQTANTPRNKFNIGLLYDNPRWLTAQIIGQYTGERYYQDSNADNTHVKSQFLVDLKMTKTIKPANGPNLSASLAINNLFDAEGYGFWYQQLDGRNLWLELSTRF